MSRVIFMCGPAGSGKSTVARRFERDGFERDGFVRLSFDQEAWARGFRSMPLRGEEHARIETELRQRLVDLVQAGRDVVLDFSFWSRRMRDDWRAVVAPSGVVPEVVYMATNRETCLQRIRDRQLGHGDDFPLEPEVAVGYFDHFEIPTSDEGPLTVIHSDH